MNKVVIIGAGGHAREVLDIYLSCRQSGDDISVLGFIDESGEVGATMCGLPILGGFEWFDGVDRSDVGVVCAVGTPELARQLVDKAQRLGLRFLSAISPLALISRTANIGQGVMIFPNVVVSCGVSLGNYSILNVASTVSHDTRIAELCSISPGVHLAGNVSLGEGCFVGMGSNVIQGVSVGAWAVLGAGAAVLHDVPAGVTVAGVPARIVKPTATLYPLTRERKAIEHNIPKLASVD